MPTAYKKMSNNMKCPVCGGNVGTIKVAFGDIICYFCWLNVNRKIKEYSSGIVMRLKERYVTMENYRVHYY